MNASMPSPVVAKFPGQSKFYRMECEDEVIILSLESTWVVYTLCLHLDLRLYSEGK